jgi:hypothetical protein
MIKTKGLKKISYKEALKLVRDNDKKGTKETLLGVVIPLEEGEKVIKGITKITFIPFGMYDVFSSYSNVRPIPMYSLEKYKIFDYDFWRSQYKKGFFIIKNSLKK